MLNTKERVAYLKENNYLFSNDKKIKNILLDPLNNVLSLTIDGELYINNILYSMKVDFIFELNSKDLMFIYTNNVVEQYVDDFECLITKKYDKVVYNENVLATLEDKTLCIYYYLVEEYNRSIYMRLDEVDDIKLEENELIIIKKGEIRFSLSSIILLS
jgi:hypothetical protein